MVSGTNVFQTVETNDPSSGGDLEFRFNAPFTADYEVSALLSCPDGGSNSLYINIDAQPVDPTMIWDVPITSFGLERRTAAWRGERDWNVTSSVLPEDAAFNAGRTSFVIRGREANTVIGPITIGISATWKMEPASGDWNNASNWTPTTVPNGSADAATFGVSNITGVSLLANTEVNGITFNPGASFYTIKANPLFSLNISGVGITNNSGIAQNLIADADAAGNRGVITFSNTASAGSLTNFTIQGKRG